MHSYREQVDHARANGPSSGPCRNDPDRWDRAVERYAGEVWAAIGREGLRADLAMETNRLTWMRLADAWDSLDPECVGEWLGATAKREARRARQLYTNSDARPGCSSADPNLRVAQALLR